ncbi:MAG TPA: DUF1349 domain-containing protein [Mucilaginibacter sp.]|nr:DUF1349 domain-containing protein [Mucilaginibacter sp.]
MNSAFKKQLLLLLCTCGVTAVVLAQSKTIKFQSIPFPMTWENTPVTYNIKGPVLTVEAGAKTDMFRDPNVTYNTDNAPKLFFTPDEDFVLTARIEHAFTCKWDGGAIVLKADALHWIKFCFEKDYTGIHRVVSVVTNDISDDCNSLPVTANFVYYKIAKAANVITLYCSGDGKKWYLVRHLQFNAKGPLHLGFMAQSPTGTHNTVTFSGVTYQHKKIKDPYTGE